MAGKVTHHVPRECFLWSGEKEKGIELGSGICRGLQL